MYEYNATALMNFLNHPYNKSIVEIIPRLVNFDSIQSQNTTENMTSKRKEILLNLFTSLHSENEEVKNHI